ncbi:hypothetical protein ZWY2020_033885 [Hordeum vulgare]|nr:hypothetical protein ZWY2020_033885 [Hordeum vulgare]
MPTPPAPCPATSASPSHDPAALLSPRPATGLPPMPVGLLLCPTGPPPPVPRHHGLPVPPPRPPCPAAPPPTPGHRGLPATRPPHSSPCPAIGSSSPRLLCALRRGSSARAPRLVLYTKPGCCLYDGLKEKMHAAVLLAGTPYSLASIGTTGAGVDPKHYLPLVLRNAIIGNYYQKMPTVYGQKPHFFRFELDHAQTRALMAMFTPSPSPSKFWMPPASQPGAEHVREPTLPPVWVQKFEGNNELQAEKIFVSYAYAVKQSKFEVEGVGLRDVDDGWNNELSNELKPEKGLVSYADMVKQNKFEVEGVGTAEVDNGHASSSKESSNGFDDLDCKETPPEWKDHALFSKGVEVQQQQQSAEQENELSFTLVLEKLKALSVQQLSLEFYANGAGTEGIDAYGCKDMQEAKGGSYSGAQQTHPEIHGHSFHAQHPGSMIKNEDATNNAPYVYSDIQMYDAYAQKVSEPSEVNNVSLRGITDFQDSMQFQQLASSNQCGNEVAESKEMLITDQVRVEHVHFPPNNSGEAIWNGVDETDTLTLADGKKIKTANIDPLALQADGGICMPGLDDASMPEGDYMDFPFFSNSDEFDLLNGEAKVQAADHLGNGSRSEKPVVNYDSSLPSPRLTSAATRRWPLRTSSSRLFFRSMASWSSRPGEAVYELDFPMIGFLDCNEMPLIPETLSGAPIVSVHKSATDGDLIVELSSGKEVVDILPSIDEIRNLACRGLIVTGPAPAGSGYDFFTRFFFPKFRIDEVMSFLSPKYIEMAKLVELTTSFTNFCIPSDPY